MVSSTSFWPWLLPLGAVQFFFGGSAAMTGETKATVLAAMNEATAILARILIVSSGDGLDYRCREG